MTRARATILPFVVLVAVSTIGFLLVQQSTRGRIELERGEAADLAAGKAFALDKRLEQLQAATATLAGILRQRDDATDLAAVADEVWASYEGARAVLLALPGREVVVLPRDAAEGEVELERVLPATGGRERPLIVGPIRVPRVGNTFWVLRPVRLAEGRGRVIVTAAVDDLLRLAGLEDLAEAGYLYQLSTVDPQSGRRRVFARSTELDLTDPEERVVELPDGGRWVLAVTPVAGWSSWRSRLLELVLVALAGLLAALWTHDLVRQPEQLRRQVATHTQRLSQASRRLAVAEAREVWRELDRFARLALLATIRDQEPYEVAEHEVAAKVAGVLEQVGVEYRRHEIESGIGRLLERGLVSRDDDGRLRLEQPVLLALPDRARPMTEIARDTLERIGAFRLERRIGGGGMGEVFYAVNVHDDSPAAVKLLYPHTVDDEEQRQRFEREGSIVARLDHPNIVRLLERGEHQGRLYIAMELLEGETLHELAEAGPLDRDTTLAAIFDVASALSVLHASGVVHRDVKSSNVIRTPGGRSILLDFGLASGVTAKTLTQSRTILGSLPYMAPERLTGERGDPSCDVWSVGIVAYELLTGRLPWSDHSQFALVNEILLGELAPFEELREIAGGPLARLVEAMLRYAPEDRIANGARLVERLLELGVKRPVTTRPAPPRHSVPARPDAARPDAARPSSSTSTVTVRTREPSEDDFPTVTATTLPLDPDSQERG